MTAFEQKRAAALELLSKTGIWRSNYCPPALRLCWMLGLKLPPPHFASFLWTAVFTGSFVASAWGLLMWFAVWGPGRVSVVEAALLSAVAGALFGLSMAGYYRYGARKHGIPSWKNFHPPTSTPPQS